VAQHKTIRPGYVVVHPNRDKASCQLTRALVVLVLLASAVLMLILTIGGWGKLEGMKPLNFVFILVYVLLAVYIWTRWARGLLPIAATMGILVLITAVIASTGMAGTSWFDREHTGFAHSQSLFGGGGLSDSVLGGLTIILAVVEVALIVITLIGFSQGWNVEQEVPEDEAKRRGSRSVSGGPQAATA
jgi:hypothetical protein